MEPENSFPSSLNPLQTLVQLMSTDLSQATKPDHYKEYTGK